jgi:putative tryptophan/tyrosine transport system substrate-binding protein
MKRRKLVVVLAGLCATPLVRAQPRARLPRVALMTSPPLPNSFAEAFRRGMRELGYVEGQNVEFDLRSAEGRPERFPSLAADIVKASPSVIVSGGGTPSARAAMRATKSIPIVFPASGDPVAEGLVQSLARPGGNVTGFSILAPETSGKRVQLIRDLLPAVKRIAILQDPVLRAGYDQVGATEESARTLGIQILTLSPGKPEDYESNYEIARNAGADALIVLPSSSFNANRQRLVALSEKHRLLTVWEHRQFAQAGGLISYGPDITELYRATARYVDRILKGAKPADLPVERASKFELVINLKTARKQGIAIPQAVLIRADQVIE